MEFKATILALLTLGAAPFVAFAGQCETNEEAMKREASWEDIVYSQLSTLKGESFGVSQKHIEKLTKYASQTQTMIIMREPNPMSMRFHNKPGYQPKPAEVKLKTRPLGKKDAGLVEVPQKPTAEQAAHIEQLLSMGYRITSEGLLKAPNGDLIFSDYDLQGVYRRGGFNTWGKLGEGKELQELNATIGENVDYIQHGANDNYIKGHKRKGAWSIPIIGRQPSRHERYLVIKIDGTYERIENTKELREFYRSQRIPWIYETN